MPTRTARKSRKTKAPAKLVEFAWDGNKYMLDLKKDRVYQNWMAVETHKGVTILGAYRQDATA